MSNIQILLPVAYEVFLAKTRNNFIPQLCKLGSFCPPAWRNLIYLSRFGILRIVLKTISMM